MSSVKDSNTHFPHTLTWCTHDFIFLGADAQEGEVIAGVKVSDSAPRLLCQAAQQSCVLHCCGVVEGGADWDA